MKKLLVALLVLGVSNAFAMGSNWNDNGALLGNRSAVQAPVRNPAVDAGWTNGGLLGTRSSTVVPAASVNAPAVDAGWNDQDLIGRRNFNSNSQTVVPSVDAGWSLQDLQ